MKLTEEELKFASVISYYHNIINSSVSCKLERDLRKVTILREGGSGRDEGYKNGYWHSIQTGGSVIYDLMRLWKLIVPIKDRVNGRFPISYFHTKKQAPTILDVGCGIGLFMKLASIVGFNVKGVEIRDYSDWGSMEIKRTDAFGYEEYSKYDIIYMYQPIFDAKKLNKLVLKIDSQIKVGTYMMITDMGLPSEIRKKYRYLPKVSQASRIYKKIR
ncbi:hypothetical protein LCGC14_1657500 [marine sediment metagenome]|uniref:Methyltransferase type 11 domain-containing protein n=1 Tax=marine sediment metagenome TaxID=412755 RepID=A0A0F9KAW0_9ZZZZ